MTKHLRSTTPHLPPCLEGKSPCSAFSLGSSPAQWETAGPPHQPAWPGTHLAPSHSQFLPQTVQTGQCTGFSLNSCQIEIHAWICESYGRKEKSRTFTAAIHHVPWMCWSGPDYHIKQEQDRSKCSFSHPYSWKMVHEKNSLLHLSSVTVCTSLPLLP